MDPNLLERLLSIVNIALYNLFLVVKERIALPNDNKHMLSYKKCYDRLFKDFKDKLV